MSRKPSWNAGELRRTGKARARGPTRYTSAAGGARLGAGPEGVRQAVTRSPVGRTVVASRAAWRPGARSHERRKMAGPRVRRLEGHLPDTSSPAADRRKDPPI